MQVGAIGLAGNEFRVPAAGRNEAVRALGQLRDDLRVLDQGPVDREGVLLHGDSTGQRVMAHAPALGLQIMGVLGPVDNRQHHPVHHRNPQAGQSLCLGRVGGQETNRGDPQVPEHLRGRGVIPGIVRQTQRPIGIHGVHTVILERIGPQLGGQADPTALMAAQVQQDPGALRGNGLQCRLQLIAAVAAVRTEGVAGETFTVHTHDRRLGLSRIAHQHGHVRDVAKGIGARGEDAVVGGQHGPGLEHKCVILF